jgi:hypothetical protein
MDIPIQAEALENTLVQAGKLTIKNKKMTTFSFHAQGLINHF